MLHRPTHLWFLGFILSIGLWSGTPVLADTPNLLADLNAFDFTPEVDNPWGGVSNGVITLPPGVQFAVDDNGVIRP